MKCFLACFLICLALVILTIFGACIPEADYSVCEFRPGQMVRSKVSGEVGQVIQIRRHSSRKWCFSDVRFQGVQEFTDSRILSNDGPISVRALTVVEYMRPYELEHVDAETP
jgi:hypothetical protein